MVGHFSLPLIEQVHNERSENRSLGQGLPLDTSCPRLPESSVGESEEVGLQDEVWEGTGRVRDEDEGGDRESEGRG